MFHVNNHRPSVSRLKVKIVKPFRTITWFPADGVPIGLFVELYVQLCGNFPTPVTDPHVCSVLSYERNIVEIFLINGEWLKYLNDSTVLKILGTLAQHSRHGENVLLNPERKFVYFFRKPGGLLFLR